MIDFLDETTMTDLNYKHLRYFWMVGRVGTIAAASKLLNVTPHAISAQLASFEASLGSTLFRRVGRRLEMTEAGERTQKRRPRIACPPGGRQAPFFWVIPLTSGPKAG